MLELLLWASNIATAGFTLELAESPVRHTKDGVVHLYERPRGVTKCLYLTLRKWEWVDPAERCSQLFGFSPTIPCSFPGARMTWAHPFTPVQAPSYISHFNLCHYLKPAGDIKKQGLYYLLYREAYCMAGRRKWELESGGGRKGRKREI